MPVPALLVVPIQAEQQVSTQAVSLEAGDLSQIPTDTSFTQKLASGVFEKDFKFSAEQHSTLKVRLRF